MFESILRGIVFNSYEKKTLASKADADERLIDFLADIAMQAECVPRGINIDNGSLGFQNTIKETPNEIGNV